MSSQRAPGRRAVARWALRLFRRDWRQQVLVITLLTVAVAAAVFGACVAFNVAPSRDAEFGSASLRLNARESDPDTLSQYVDAAEASFGTIDVIAYRALPVPGSTQDVDIRSQDPKGAYGGPMLALREGRYPTNTDEIALTDGALSDFGVEFGGEVTFDGRPRSRRRHRREPG